MARQSAGVDEAHAAGASVAVFNYLGAGQLITDRSLASKYDEQATAGGAIRRDEHFANDAGTPTGTSVARGLLNDAALHQNVPEPGELVGICDSRLRGETAHQLADGGEVRGARATERMIDTHFQQHSDERAGLEVIALEPVIEDIEDGEQAPVGIRGASTSASLVAKCRQSVD